MQLKRNLLSVALASATMLIAADAQAQETGQPGTPGQDATTLDSVVVTGIRAGIESSISTKKDSTSIVEAISAEDIGKLPDVSIAESIARLPGLAAQRVAGRAQVISVRGLSPDFATTLLNGREVVSTGDNRSVEFDQYPSELFNGVTVYKTPDASLVGQGLSATIDMQTVRPLSFGEPVAVFGARYQKNSLGSAADSDGRRQPHQRQLHRPVPRQHPGLLDRLLASGNADPGRAGRPVRAVVGDRRRLAPGRAGRHVLLRRHQGAAPHRLRRARRRDGHRAVPPVQRLDQHAGPVPHARPSRSTPPTSSRSTSAVTTAATTRA